MNATPPPGWYPDNRGGVQRYWDGQKWTEHIAPGVTEPPPGHPSHQGATPLGAATGTSQGHWFVRHKILSGVAAFVLLMIILAALTSEGDDSTPARDTSSEASGDPAAEVSPVAEPETEPEPVDTDGDGVNDEDDFRLKDPKVQTRDDVDTDRDGVPDYRDDFPKDANYSMDTDGDSVPDRLDDFPKDPKYSKDTDGDGSADSKDAFPSDPGRWKITFAMDNALAAAQNYLEVSPFSRQGLIDQLSSEYGSGFGVEDATWAVGQLNVDWKQQAVRAAKNYLDVSPFSHQGLIDQLSSPYGSQFTLEEAIYAVNKIGL
jgi:hypothetical protein